MTRVQVRLAKVEDYVKERPSTRPLVFDAPATERELLLQVNLRGLVKRILYFTHLYESRRLNEDGTIRFETAPRRWRSSFDIWRHVIAIRPEVTLPQVMRCLYDLYQTNQVTGHYCLTTGLRVFKLLSSYGGHSMWGHNHIDEYRIHFTSWKQFDAFEGEFKKQDES